MQLSRNVLEIGCGTHPIAWNGEQQIRYVGVDPSLNYSVSRQKAEAVLAANPKVIEHALVPCVVARVEVGRPADEVVMVDVLGSLAANTQSGLLRKALQFRGARGEVLCIENTNPQHVRLDGHVRMVADEFGLTTELHQRHQPGFEQLWNERLDRQPSSGALILRITS